MGLLKLTLKGLGCLKLNEITEADTESDEVSETNHRVGGCGFTSLSDLFPSEPETSGSSMY